MFFRKLLIYLLLLCPTLVLGQQGKEIFIKSGNSINTEIIEDLVYVNEFYKPFIHNKLQDIYLLTLSEEMELDDVEAVLSNYIPIYIIEFVPNYDFFWTPNDYDASFYNLDLIQAEGAWDILNDASDVKIAVIDDAIDINHPDLAANIYYNTAEIDGNGIDDDGNGFIDDYVGWDFADNDADPSPPNFGPLLDHGTHVSGIASAVTNNAIGMASIGSNAKIIPVKIGQDGTGFLLNGAQGIDYAMANGADVINMSWGGGPYSAIFQVLFDIAYEEGILCVAAAGNSSSSLPMYPASYDHVISVASTNQTDEKSWFSNYGTTVDVAAPGSDIFSCLTGGTDDYGFKSGTSMASPTTAGLLALMKGANPIASIEQIEACLYSTCDPVNGSFGGDVGAGRINALQALECITSISAEFDSDFTQVCPGQEIQFFNYSSGTDLVYDWTFPGGFPSSSTEQNPIITYNDAGVYSVSLEISNGTDGDFLNQIDFITISQPTAEISGYSQIYPGGIGSVIVNFVGNPPFDIVINDGTTDYEYNDIYSSPFLTYFSVDESTVYEITAFNDAQCEGEFSGEAEIVVVPFGEVICDEFESSMIKYLGTTNDDQAQGIERIGEHGYIVLGRKDVGPNNFRIYIARLDVCGTLLWEKIYNPTTYGIPVSAKLDGDEILVTGYYGSPVQTFFTRLDLDGNIMEAMDFGSSNADYPRYMDVNADGDVIMGGVTNSTADSFGANDYFLLKTNTDGDMVWGKNFGGIDSDFLHSFFFDQNQNIISVGYFRDYSATLWSGAVFKTDTDGNTEWGKRIDMGDGQTVFGSGIEVGSDYFITGRTDHNTMGGNDGVLVKLDSDGNLLWSKRFGGAGSDIASAIAYNGDEIFVMGYSDSGADNVEIFICVFDVDGNMTDQRNIGTTGNDFSWNAGKQLVASDIYGVYGVATGNDNFIGGKDVLFFKFGELDDICEEVELDFSVEDGGLELFDFAFSQGSIPWSNDDLVFSSEDVISNQGFLCSDIVPSDSINQYDCELEIDFNYTGSTCLLDSFLFEEISIDDIDVDFWLWDFGDGNDPEFGTENSITHYFETEGSYDVQLIAGNLELGCLDTLILNLEIDVVDAICAIDLEEFNSYCSEGEILVSNGSESDVDDVIYEWSFLPDGSPNSFVGEDPPSVTFPSSGVKEIILDMNLDCGTLSDTLVVTIFDPPEINLGPGETSCEALQLELGTEAIAGWNYEWAPEEIFDDPNASSQNFWLNENTTIYMQITDLWTGCTIIDSLHYQIDSVEVSIFLDQIEICEGDIEIINYEVSEGANLVWSPSNIIVNQTESTIQVEPNSSILLTAQATVLDGFCEATDQIFLDYSELPEAQNISSVICLDDVFEYTPDSDWTMDGVIIEEIVIDNPGIYQYTEQNNCGEVLHTIEIEVENCNCHVYVPNATTPNWDDLNQLFGPVSTCDFDEYRFSIFNRWGEVVFTSNDVLEKWDGTYKKNMVQDGIYAWKLEYSQAGNPDLILKQGHVTVLR